VRTDSKILNDLADMAYHHIEQLAGEIGPRGTCTEGEQKAAKYLAAAFQDMGLTEVETMRCRVSPSSYARYALIFFIALSNQLTSFIIQESWFYLLSAVILGLCAASIYLESDFQANWSRLVIRSQPSSNVLGCCSSSGSHDQTVVITAHIDTHRTPFFNASTITQRLYNIGFRSINYGMIITALLASLLTFVQSPFLLWVNYVIAVAIFLVLITFISADQTPFSPGAYDNASGVACMLAVGHQLKVNPLERTSVWIVATGGEETGSEGIQALLKQRAKEWHDALWINLDQTGIGSLYLRTREGILKRYSASPDMIILAHQTAKSADIPLRERQSQAFSDATPILKQGFKVISLGANPEKEGAETPRHQRRDKPDLIEIETLRTTIHYVLQLLRIWDQREIHA
jgi:hypothetical protein